MEPLPEFKTPELQLPHGETLDRLWELVSFQCCCDRIPEIAKKKKAHQAAGGDSWVALGL